MKKIILLFLVLIFTLSCLSIAYADEIDINDSSDSSIDIVDSRTNPYLDGDVVDRLDNIIEYLKTPVEGSVDVVEVKSTTEVLRVSASDTSGLHSIILSLIGDYNPIVTDHEYRNNNNTYYSHSIDISPDWSWIASSVIFLVIIYCAFRIIGIVIGRL